VGTLRGFYKLVARLLLICLVASVAEGADFWVKKPYQNWSAEEVQQMLSDSPWARPVTLAHPAARFSGGRDGAREGGVDQELLPSITYTLQFRSARPIREAQVRSSQLKSHYDKMSPEQKAAFDANADKFLAVTFPDRVVVSVTFRADILDHDRILRDYWQKQDVAKLSQFTFLNTGTEKLKLIDYGFQENTFQFVFPHPTQLRPDEKISVEFVSPRFWRFNEERVFEEFSVKKMMVNGEPVL
jgi:hypothetical protein